MDNGNVAFSGNGSSQEGINIKKVGGTLNVVANRNTPIPGGIGNFTGLGGPSLDNGNVAFGGEGSSLQRGIYTNIGGTLNIVANTNTPIPGSTGNFTGFSDLSLDNRNVAFSGFGSSQEGIYIKKVGGTLKLVADLNTPIPGGSGNFSTFRVPSLDKGNVAFIGNTGIYTTLRVC